MSCIVRGSAMSTSKSPAASWLGGFGFGGLVSMAVGGLIDAGQVADELADEVLDDVRSLEHRLEKLGREKKGESDGGSTRCPSECEKDSVVTGPLWSSPEPERPMSWALGLDRGDYEGHSRVELDSQEAAHERTQAVRVHNKFGLVFM